MGPGPPPRPHFSSPSSLRRRTDLEAVQELESSLKEIRKTASGTALYYAGLFLWLMGRHDRAKEYIDRMLKLSSSSREVLPTGIVGPQPEKAASQHALVGWLVLPRRAMGVGEGPSWALARPWVSRCPHPRCLRA